MVLPDKIIETSCLKVAHLPRYELFPCTMRKTYRWTDLYVKAEWEKEPSPKLIGLKRFL